MKIRNIYILKYAINRICATHKTMKGYSDYIFVKQNKTKQKILCQTHVQTFHRGGNTNDNHMKRCFVNNQGCAK